MIRPPGRRNAGVLLFPAVVLVAVITGVGCAVTDLGAAGPWIFGFVLSGWVVTLCLHEFSHSVAALAGGDVSVRSRGYLSLNPLRYTNPVYSLVMPIIFLIAGGLPLPGGAVLIETHRLRRPWYSALVSAAGPTANLVSGIVLTLLAGVLPTGRISGAADSLSGLVPAVTFLALLQFVTFLLNLLPVPGLDGFGVLSPFLPPRVHRAIAPFVAWAPIALFLLLWTSPRVSAVLFRFGYWALGLLHGEPYAASLAAGEFQFWR